MTVSYDNGFNDGYAEGYACKLADATEPFSPQSLNVPQIVEAVADMLATKYQKVFTDRPSAIGCARLMISTVQAQAQEEGK